MRLIDAESLWKAISNVGFPALNRNGYIDRQCVYELIKKAPTVPQLDFKEGYKQAIKDGKTNFSRPKKGKWIKQENKKTEFFCSECGRMIDTKPFTRTDNFPFCHCGADMRDADND